MAFRRNHHFVPQFLLGNFAFDEQRRRVRLFRIPDSRAITSASVRHQCARRNLYGADGVLESALGTLEGRTARIVHGLSEGQVPAPDTRDFDTLMMFIAVQHQRTPAATEAHNEQLTQYARAIAKGNPGLPPHLASYLDGIRVENPSALDFQLALAVRAALLLRDLRLKVLVRSCDVEFVLGDAPVVLHNQWCRRITAVGSAGFACAGLLVFLPLSPDHLCVLFDPDVYRIGRAHDDVVYVDENEQARSLNGLQYAAALENVYYRGDSMHHEIAALPPQYRAHRGLVSSRYRGVASQADPDTRSELVMVHHIPLNVDLHWGAIQLRCEVRGVPFHERVSRSRPEAQMVLDLLQPPGSRPLHDAYERIE